ncbi:ATPase domain-containing protein [Xanthomonas fragariae]|uniref:non-specific serine/threonine protein kinase n=1 Tax=Xanthomonas fragariae TaxID=48664 RepID=A0A1Y6H958_9XANT|nr:ATPase domain-containing protein [Xanthomonas fragariae]AOD14791.1 circadian clock protein KaiC [Xanthomonas fragariae]AOD18185.1 circadian clock protein KaiC [Xanthomonas fragariae]ENZ96401.1 recombinase A [Xanthomonas fragariae LMG 25863]MBL9195802.1 AAA family ATPase [Xanthomonas fragariae]MBL9220689.1 AAA family ATPase [Xanthomonas fragariae]
MGNLKPTIAKRITTGSEGLDRILRGGLPPNRLYLLEGQPGSGKTTVALKFLLDGAAKGESCLYVTLSETIDELNEVAASHNWVLDGLHIFELASAEAFLSDGRQQSILHPWEVELDGTIKLIQSEVDRVKPTRVVFDSLSELLLLAQDPLRYRRQMLVLKQFFAPRNITVFLVDDLTSENGERDAHLHSLCHGVISLERMTLDFGAARRRMQVQKLRGVDFIAGYHDLTITTGGMRIYPRLIASDHHVPFIADKVSSGVERIDALLYGGPLRGTSTLLTGPSGSGKTSIALQYVSAACERGEHCCILEFDERTGTLLTRAESLGIDLRKHLDSGLLELHQMDPAELTPGEFAWAVRASVEERNCRMLVIDSLNGYLSSMPQEKQLMLQMHELLSYLNQIGVTTFLISPQHGLVGTMPTGNLNISYLADSVILFRFFEVKGRIRKALSVIKNRSGAHEDSIRELRIGDSGIHLSEPLEKLHGVLTGTPQFIGDDAPLLDRPLDHQ